MGNLRRSNSHIPPSATILSKHRWQKLFILDPLRLHQQWCRFLDENSVSFNLSVNQLQVPFRWSHGCICGSVHVEYVCTCVCGRLRKKALLKSNEWEISQNDSDQICPTRMKQMLLQTCSHCVCDRAFKQTFSQNVLTCSDTNTTHTHTHAELILISVSLSPLQVPSLRLNTSFTDNRQGLTYTNTHIYTGVYVQGTCPLIVGVISLRPWSVVCGLNPGTTLTQLWLVWQADENEGMVFG